ncbi:MAG TPA: hypothetical protein VFY29_14750 [Terriglobia bacterium]|nr:hypothetical protein [Terriglobia bacterium]
MKIDWLGGATLSAKARELVDFDMASIRQTVAAARGVEPSVWVVSPGDYESGGRILRDSPVHRLAAYAPESRTLYATDGCNSCVKNIDLSGAGRSALEACAAESGVPLALLERLAALASGLGISGTDPS